MTYNPNIPTGLVPFNQDYLNVQGNFSAADTVFGINHLEFSNATAQKGYHKSISMVPESPTPAAIAGFGQIYTETVSAAIDGFSEDQTLFYQSGGGLKTKLTLNFLPSAATNGYTFLPGGIVFQWGRVNSPGKTGTVTFATSNKAFPNNCFNVSLTLRRAGSDSNQSIYLDSLPTKTAFTFTGTTNTNDTLFWTAIGN